MRYVFILSIGGEVDESYGVSGPHSSKEVAKTAAIEMLRHTKAVYGGELDEENLRFIRDDDPDEDRVHEVTILALTDEEHVFHLGYSASEGVFFPWKNGKRTEDVKWGTVKEAYEDGVTFGMWRASHPPQLIWFA